MDLLQSVRKVVAQALQLLPRQAAAQGRTGLLCRRHKRARYPEVHGGSSHGAAAAKSRHRWARHALRNLQPALLLLVVLALVLVLVLLLLLLLLLLPFLETWICEDSTLRQSTLDQGLLRRPRRSHHAVTLVAQVTPGPGFLALARHLPAVALLTQSARFVLLPDQLVQ